MTERFETQACAFDYVWFDDDTPLPIDDHDSPLPKNATPGIESLCTLAVFTERFRRRGLSGSPSEGISHLLKPLWNAKKSAWPITIFRENPFDRFIHRKGTNDEPLPRFDEQVEISISFSGSAEVGHAEMIDRLCKHLLKSVPTPPAPKPEIRIHGPRELISASTEDAMLLHGDHIQIEVSCEREDEPCVFWIDSRNGSDSIVELYPELEITLDDTSADEAESSSRQVILIPGNQTLRIDTPKGTETCLVMLSKKRLSRAAKTTIKDALAATLKIRAGSHHDSVRAIHYPSRHSPHQPQDSLRLGPPETPNAWEEAVIRALKPDIKRLHFLHIPNHG